MTHRPSPAARLLLTTIAAWRWLISPLYPPCCRFHPTCSSYCREAVQVHGALRGGLLGLYRLSRCHPLGGQGWDPVPPAGEYRLKSWLLRRGSAAAATSTASAAGEQRAPKAGQL